MSTPASLACPLLHAPATPLHCAYPDGMALGSHMRHCADARGRWFSMECVVEATHAFLAPRFVTTLALAALAFGIASMLF